MNPKPLVQTSQAFLNFLDDWTGSLTEMRLADAIPDPGKAAILSVDIVKGFCTVGPLASPRVNAIVAPTVRLFTAAWARGLRNILLFQDTHEPDAVEFEAWPRHCVRGTEEAQPVEAFQALPFFDQLPQYPKNSIDSRLNTGLTDWMMAHPEVDTYLVVGDCTDLCTYQLAMYMRLDANARQLKRRVIVPVDCVDTYDLSVATAAEVGGLPHDADLIHAVFLYHMALNGIEVVAKIT